MQVMLNIPGTVMTVGGDAEITKASSHFHYPAGVISTLSPYLMNSAADGQALALVGCVPVSVVGNITKGMPICKTSMELQVQTDKDLVEPH